ncbi:class I SAM-dependent methyltransferase [Arthrobacter sp. H20]|uniref:class I SAM-dependent methyltransferase n=1 Tax=Arthrobacter sp. H20 TaxID=1267981 RepID=UPI00047A3E13|nr:class I SAM-dependent methyltransferase [Arthrobacter sp. H20]
MQFLAHRDLGAVEEMDKPDCDPVLLDRTYAQFGLVNGAVAGWRRTWAGLIRPQLSASRPSTLLDIGSGGGDMPRAFARWAKRDGVQLTILAIDPDKRAHSFATAQPHQSGLSFRRAFSAELVAEGERFDVVTSNHLLHHLTPDQLQALLSDSEQLCNGIAVHNDIERSRSGYVLFSIGALPLRRSLIRQDGLTSIRRSYTAAELAEVAPPGWEVRAGFPSHNLLIHRASHA